MHDRHVGLPGLDVLLCSLGVHGFHGQRLTEDIGEFDAVPVLAAHEFLLLLVVVRRGQKFPKDQLWNPDLVLGVLENIDTLAVVLYRNCRVVNRDVDVLDGCVA